MDTRVNAISDLSTLQTDVSNLESAINALPDISTRLNSIQVQLDSINDLGTRLTEAEELYDSSVAQIKQTAEEITALSS